MSRQQELIRVCRYVDALLIPHGTSYRLAPGSRVRITQALGGSFTLYHDGSLLRLPGADADALGLTPEDVPPLPEALDATSLEAWIWTQLRTCYDPEIPIDIVELGLVYRMQIRPRGDGQYNVEIDMTVTAPGCGMGTVIAEEAAIKIDALPQIGDVHVNVVFDPPWERSMMSEAARLQTGLVD